MSTKLMYQKDTPVEERVFPATVFIGFCPYCRKTQSINWRKLHAVRILKDHEELCKWIHTSILASQRRWSLAGASRLAGEILGRECSITIRSHADKLEASVLTLKEREQYVLLNYVDKQRTMTEIAEELGITRSRVQQIIQKSLRKLRYVKRLKIWNDSTWDSLPGALTPSDGYKYSRAYEIELD